MGEDTCPERTGTDPQDRHVLSAGLTTSSAEGYLTTGSLRTTQSPPLQRLLITMV